MQGRIGRGGENFGEGTNRGHKKNDNPQLSYLKVSIHSDIRDSSGLMWY